MALFPILCGLICSHSRPSCQKAKAEQETMHMLHNVFRIQIYPTRDGDESLKCIYHFRLEIKPPCIGTVAMTRTRTGYLHPVSATPDALKCVQVKPDLAGVGLIVLA
jgi:hypothetical protein